jgi:hypothetical protein
MTRRSQPRLKETGSTRRTRVQIVLTENRTADGVIDVATAGSIPPTDR